MSSSDEIRKFIQIQDLGLNDNYKIDGPWAFKGLDGFEAPIYIFQKGTGEKIKIGKVIATTGKGLKFEIEIKDGFEDIDVASFEVPMRFLVKLKKQ